MNAVVNWTPPADHLAPVYAQWALDVVDGSGVYLNTRDGRKVLDLYGGHAVAALGYSHPRLLAALEAQAKVADLPEQCRAARRACAGRAAPDALRRSRPQHRVLHQHGRRSERERAEAGIANHGPAQGRRHRRQLPRPHGCCRRRDLGRGEEMVWLSAGAVRRRVRAARRPRRNRSDHRHGHGRRDRRTRAGCRRRARPRRAVPRGAAQALHRDLRAARLRRGAVRHGSHRLPVRRQHVWHLARHDHDGQGARCRLPVRRAADGGSRRRPPEDWTTSARRSAADRWPAR